GNIADADITSMAVQALANYYDTYDSVKTSVDTALMVLSDMQESDGGYSSRGTKNAESCAQVICALGALGINPEEDLRFIKDGNSVVDALLLYYDETTGGFVHVSDGKVNQMATEQAAYALAAYEAVINGGHKIYDMTNNVTVLYNSKIVTQLLNSSNSNSNSSSNSNTNISDKTSIVGTIVKYKGLKYKIISSSKARCTGFSGKSKKSVVIPRSIKVSGKTYKVTSIAAGAFKNNKKIAKVTISKNVTIIGTSAFKGCKKLKTIILKGTKTKKIRKNAFKGISQKAKFNVLNSKRKTYKKLLKRAGGYKKTWIVI
ncbi:MAG: leucine-rich repeat protein, partial [Eubacterium sp.]